MTDSNPTKRLCTRSTTTIQELNDDVLRDTFQYLDDQSLEAIARVCPAFRWNAQAEYSTRRKHQYNAFYIKWQTERFDLGRMLSALRSFGPAMRFLKITLYNCRELSPAVLESLTQHVGETLIGLILENIDFTNAIMPIIRPSLSRLREINLKGCSWEVDTDLSGMILSCPELVTLSIHGISNSFGTRRFLPLIFPVQNLPELVSFTVICCHHIQENSFRKFLKMNPQLKEIEIDSCPIITIPSIVQCCPQIVKLKYVSFELLDFIENAKQLARLTALKSLHLYCGGYPIAPAIHELVVARIRLDCLQLHSFISSEELMNGILQLNELNGLKELEIAAGESVELKDILKIVNRLNELTTLKLSSKSIFPGHLVHIVRFAPKLQLLEYDFLDKTRLNLKFERYAFESVLSSVAAREPLCRLVLKMPAQIVSVPLSLQCANENLLKLVYCEGD